MRMVCLVVLCSCVLLGCSASGWAAPVPLPHTVAIVEPLKLSLEQTADGLHFSVTCVDTQAYKDVKAQFTIDGELKIFSYGQPFGTDQQVPPQPCDDETTVLEGDLGQFQSTTVIFIYFAVLYPDRTYRWATASYRIEPNGRVYTMTRLNKRQLNHKPLDGTHQTSLYLAPIAS